jgi:signal transduction histidine kinase
MSQQELRQTLHQLRSEAEGLAGRDPNAAERIRQLIAGLERQLQSSGDPRQRESLLESLPTTIEQLEVEHPNVTAILSRLITTLSSMGI